MIKLSDKYFDRRLPTHVGKQRGPGGLRLHVEQVEDFANFLNQFLSNSYSEETIRRVALYHDFEGILTDLTAEEQEAIAVTKKPANSTEVYKRNKLAIIILLADMWSAFVNERNMKI